MSREKRLIRVTEKVGKRTRQAMARTPDRTEGIISDPGVAEARQVHDELVELRTRVERLEEEVAKLKQDFGSHESVSRPR